MTRQGADVERLRQFAKTMDKSANDLQVMGARLTASINATQAWKGADADRFRTSWNGQLRAQVARSVAALQQGAQALSRNADEQERASSGAGGAAAPAGAGWAGARGDGVGDVKGGADWFDKIGHLLGKIDGNPLMTLFGKIGEVEKALEKLGGASGLEPRVLNFVRNADRLLAGMEFDDWISALGSKLGSLGQVDGLLSKLGVGIEEIGRFGPFERGAGVLGVVGAVASAGSALYQTVDGVRDGNTHEFVDGILSSYSQVPVLGTAAWEAQLVYDHWDQISHGALGVGEDVVDAGSDVVGGLHDAFGDTKNFVMGGLGGIGGALGGFHDPSGKVGGLVKGLAG